MARCETSRLGAIACLISSLLQRVLHRYVKTFDMIFLKDGRRKCKAAELALEGCSLFISGQKQKRRVRKQTVGNRFIYFFLLLKETFRDEMR